MPTDVALLDLLESFPWWILAAGRLASALLLLAAGSLALLSRNASRREQARAVLNLLAPRRGKNHHQNWRNEMGTATMPREMVAGRMLVTRNRDRCDVLRQHLTDWRPTSVLVARDFAEQIVTGSFGAQVV
jgi:hypothetical protein